MARLNEKWQNLALNLSMNDKGDCSRNYRVCEWFQGVKRLIDEITERNKSKSVRK